jgi:hypothetical protein
MEENEMNMEYFCRAGVLVKLPLGHREGNGKIKLKLMLEEYF